jgi:hypothetical protein
MDCRICILIKKYVRKKVNTKTSEKITTYLLGPKRSALAISSATIAKKSCICSVDVPWFDKVDTHDKIQSGQRDGWPGASLRAREVS